MSPPKCHYWSWSRTPTGNRRQSVSKYVQPRHLHSLGWKQVELFQGLVAKSVFQSAAACGARGLVTPEALSQPPISDSCSKFSGVRRTALQKSFPSEPGRNAFCHRCAKCRPTGRVQASFQKQSRRWRPLTLKTQRFSVFHLEEPDSAGTVPRSRLH